MEFPLCGVYVRKCLLENRTDTRFSQQEAILKKSVIEVFPIFTCLDSISLKKKKKTSYLARFRESREESEFKTDWTML